MVVRKNTDFSIPVVVKQKRIEPLRAKTSVSIGIDIGSTSSDIAILNDDGDILFSDYRRTEGKPAKTVRIQLGEILRFIDPSSIVLTASTGSASRLLAKILNIPFINEVTAQAASIARLYPQLKEATIIEMGGQDAKLIFLSTYQGKIRIRDFALNTACAAGTGSFLDQQAQRLGVDIEGEFSRLALQSKSVPRMAGRCSVFAKSDMIHLQQQATPNCDIIAGLCLALARNLKSNLGCGREFVKPIIFTGGVAANEGVVRAFEQVFDLEEGELIVPKEHFFTGAMGAVLAAKKRLGRGEFNKSVDFDKMDDYLSRSSGLEKAPRREPLPKPSLPLPGSIVYGQLLSQAKEPIKAYLGVDVGSISTNVVVIDEKKRVLAKSYLMTAGQPLEAVRRGLDIVGKMVTGKVKILGAATTGSGRYLTGDFIGADLVINEITAQAAGTAIVNPKVDTIFEIGGQDSKYISLENGVVVDFEMNHACAAGTGSFLEEQAQRLGINIDEEFAELAFDSKAPIKLGERCTVFMESDLLSYQQQGAQTRELVAGLSYSIVSNYLNRVVGRRKIGNNICFQGGTAFNKAVWSAFEKITGKPVMVPDHHEVTGAIGAASIVAERMVKDAEKSKKTEVRSNFRGFDNLVSVEYSVESFTCEHCPNHCEIKKVQLPGSEPLYYGSRCDRYNIKKQELQKKSLGAFEYRYQKMLEFSGISTSDKKARQGWRDVKIGIPVALTSWQLLPLFARFFKSLGFEIVLSGLTNKKTIRMGVESVTAQPCFPVKVAFGHIAELIDKQVDYVFLPSIVSMISSYPQNERNQLCPYVQSLPYQVRTAFADKLGRTKILTTPLRMGESKSLLRKGFAALGEQLGVSGSDVLKAMEEGLLAQEGFEKALEEKGRDILGKLEPGQRLFVLVSRPYNGCDDGVNMRLPKKLAELGVEIIPMDMLNLESARLGDESLHRHIYWSYGQKILRAAEVIKSDPRLFAIYLSNFSCGPDSFLLTFFKDIMAGGSSHSSEPQKPCLQLEIDEHSADAGIITRLEAFLESLKNYDIGRKQDEQELHMAEKKDLSGKRTIYIPYMGDAAYGVAACFRSYGQPAEVIPIADESALIKGRQFTSGKECLPCAITAGEMLKLLAAEGVDPNRSAFFMPGGSGPCRFGMYNCMHKLILRYAGMEDVTVISPNQDGSFYSEISESVDGVGIMNFLKGMWVATVGLDLLHKLILRLRPFAREQRKAQNCYERSIKRWIQAVENRMNLAKGIELMDSIADEFKAVEVDNQLQKPRVGIVGEIYVRSHPFANMNIIARLEELGAACELASLAEWIYYTNFTRSRRAQRKWRFRDGLTNSFQNYLQHRIEKKLAEPLEKRFGRLAETPVEHVIESARPYLHDSFEGEAVLSVGKMVEHHHQGVGGVVNVMPFSCMPSTIVSSQTRRISADCGDMPILNLSYDGQEDATMTTRLEAFVEQVRQRQQGVASVADLLATGV